MNQKMDLPSQAIARLHTITSLVSHGCLVSEHSGRLSSFRTYALVTKNEAFAITSLPCGNAFSERS
ncbi:hypothetical protein [Nostoc sp. 106C]|uniref:hypothetical protein n=1 Tax=Nostoc sp. 106C TaxID=1932667 RepID=UPI001066A76D|nr:hypothetical protein [Nostoc sp. 106C]